MKSTLFAVIVFTLFYCLPSMAMVAFAEPPANNIDQNGNGSAPRLAIVEDQKSAAFRFMIDGQEVARLDSAGLYVREGISHGGVLTDSEPTDFDARITQGAKAK